MQQCIVEDKQLVVAPVACLVTNHDVGAGTLITDPPASSSVAQTPLVVLNELRSSLQKLNQQRRQVARDVPKHAEIADGTVFWCLFNLLKTPLNAL